MILFDKLVKVKDVLSKVFCTMTVDDCLQDAIDMMAVNNLNEVFIVNHSQKPIGVITKKDISECIKNKASLSKKVDFLVSEDFLVINENETLSRCRDIMVENKIGRLPVVKGDKIQGIIRNSEIRDHYYMTIEDRYHQMMMTIDELHEAVCIVNKKGIVVVWNKNAEKLYNLDREEIIGEYLGDYFPKALLTQVIQTEVPQENLVHDPREGSYVAISASPIYMDGKMIGAVSSERDITEVYQLSDRLQALNDTVDFLKNEVKKISADSFDEILGYKGSLKDCVNVAKQVSKTEASILITGESGTGKEVFARAIHNFSEKQGVFVPVNCGAIPDELFESEFFGYESGAFTGASKKGKQGFFELANEGTLFLDEVAEMPLNMQAKLLRVLQEKEIRRVGGSKIKSVYVRILAATNKDLQEMVREGTFREDLYYRLNVIEINLPPLRERQEDFELYVQNFIDEICRENKKQKMTLDKKTMDLLKIYRWRGNVRELKNTLEHMVVLCQNRIIDESYIPGYIMKEINKEELTNYDEKDLNVAVEHLEKRLIVKALKECQGNKVKAAEYLNIKRSTLYYKIKFYDIEL